MIIRTLSLTLLLVSGVVAAVLAAPGTRAQTDAAIAIDLASPEAVLDIGPALAERKVNDASDAAGGWFTVTVRNGASAPVTRVLATPEMPGLGLAIMPPVRRPALVEAGAFDNTVAIERAPATGDDAIRVVVPPQKTATLALHFQGVRGRPSVLAWMEPALIARNRQNGVLTGVVSGLLAAATAFVLGAALLSGHVYALRAAPFLVAVLLGDLVSTGLFDNSWLAFQGPYALLALALAGALAAGVRLLDHIAPFEWVRHGLGLWSRRVGWIAIALGLAAFAGVPASALAIRILVLLAAIGATAYLIMCARLGNASARRLAPAASIFALIAIGSACNGLGLFGVSLIASGAIGGFSAAGALLVALAVAVPTEAFKKSLPEAAPEPPAWPQDAQPSASSGETFEWRREIQAVTASRQGVFDLDLQTGLVSLSAEAADLLGLPAGAVELSPETWINRIHIDDRDVYRQALEAYRHDPGTAFRLEFRARAAGGRTAWFELRATMTGQSTEAERCLGLIANVTGRKIAESAEVSPGPSDALTGLGTRAALLSQLESLRGELKGWALAVFDLDRFKAVNRSLGRESGDALLVALAERLGKAFAGANDIGRATLFRLGGDMFAALSPDVPDLKAFGGRFVDVLSPPFNVDGRDIFLPVSVGVASGARAEDVQELLSQAELAMIEVKRDGGGQVRVYSGAMSPAEASDPVALETELRRAIEKNEFELHYQPIMRLKDGVVAGFEALVRWRHPERGLVDPNGFVPYAERSGLIIPIGRLALQHAANDLARWQQFFPSKPPLFVSVNVAWRQLGDPGFVKDIAALLKTAPIAKGSLRLEVTESAVMAGADRAEKTLKKLKSLGASLAIDDFGTGHSSLSHLARFPFDVIKIDKSFLTAAHEKAGTAILRSIVMLAHELRLGVVAEGVELAEEAARLREMGCEYGQGYLLGTPVPASEINRVIASAQVR